MKKKLPIGRTIAHVIAGLLLLTGTFFLFEAYRIRQEFHRQSETHPLDLLVDFSDPGEFSCPFPQTWQACHGQAINLHLPAMGETNISPSELLATLNLTWQITDSDGEVVRENESSGEIIWDNKQNGGTIALAYFWPFETGDYTFSCLVVTGAPALVGLEQRLVCQYQPCGLEMLAAAFCMGIGIAAFVIAGTVLLVVRAITKRQSTSKGLIARSALSGAAIGDQSAITTRRSTQPRN